MAKTRKGKVYFVGTGPGDPGLITVAGRRAIRRADVIAYRDDINPQFFKEALPTAEFADLTHEEWDGPSLVKFAQEGKRVACLLTGDPFSLKDISDVSTVQKAGIPFEIVPGIDIATASATYAGIAFGHLDFADNFTIFYPGYPHFKYGISGQVLNTQQSSLIFSFSEPRNLRSLYLAEVVQEIKEAGNPPETSVAVISKGATWQQQTIVGTLADIVEKIEKAGFVGNEATVIVGPAVYYREMYRWFDRPEVRPLLGKRVVVTRAREQAEAMVGKLSDLGALAIEFPVIQIVPPESWDEIDRAIDTLAEYDWVVFTSANGVAYFWERVMEAGKDARLFGTVKLCAIGPATAAELEKHGLSADLIPARFVAEGILEALGEVRGQKFLLPRADIARENLVVGLEERGAFVNEITAYRTVLAEDSGPAFTSAAELVEMFGRNEIDVVTFTSSSTVRNFAARLATVTDTPLPELLGEHTLVACIGPITAGTARELGLRVDLEAAEFTIDKLVEAIQEKVQSA